MQVFKAPNCLSMCEVLMLSLLCRPMNRILVAQRITQPQAWIQGLVTLFHLAINYLLVNIVKGPFYMTAWAYTISTVFTCLLFTSYFAVSGKSYCSWGTGLTTQAFRVGLQCLKVLELVRSMGHAIENSLITTS